MKVSMLLQQKELVGLTTPAIIPFSPVSGLNEPVQLLQLTALLVWEPPSIAPVIPRQLHEPGKVNTHLQGITRLLEH